MIAAQSIPEPVRLLAAPRPLPVTPTNGEEVLAYNTALVLNALRALGLEAVTVEYDEDGRMTLSSHPNVPCTGLVDGYTAGPIGREVVEPWQGDLTQALFKLCAMAVRLKHEELEHDGTGSLTLNVKEMTAYLECRDYVITTETSEYEL